MRHKIAATVFTILAVCTTTAWADVVAPDEPLPGMSDVELDERLRYLTVEIAKNAHYARAWHGVFVTMYGAGLMVESARAAIETESAARADYTYGAVKALIGVAGRLARPLRAVAGPSPEEVAPGDDRPARLQRLRVAEAMLRVDAKESDRRSRIYSARSLPIRHLPIRRP